MATATTVLLSRGSHYCVRTIASMFPVTVLARQAIVCQTGPLPAFRWSHHLAPVAFAPPQYRDTLIQLERNNTRILLRTHLLPKSKIEKAIESMIFWSRQSTDEGTELSWRLLDLLVKNQVRISATIVNQLLSGWKERPHKLRSRGVLVRLAEYEPHVQADTNCYSIVLETAANHGDLPEVLDMIEDALHRMQPSQQTDRILQQIHHIKSNHAPNTPIEEQHETSTTQLSPIDMEQALFDPANQPTSKDFNQVLQAWINSTEHPDRIATYCVDILRRMEGLVKDGHDRVNPTTVTYSLVLTAAARAGQARLAETILKELLYVYQEYGAEIQKPNKMHFSAVINAWAKSSEPGAPQRAWNLLQTMQRIADETKDPELMPGTVTYNTVLNAWAKSNDTAFICTLLQDMWTLYEQGHFQTKPNLFTYNTVLNAIAESGDAVQAERLLLELHTRYRQGDQDLRPDVTCYNTVLKAWKNSRKKDAPERAMHLLDEMERLAYEEQGFNTLPDRVTYTTIIHIWSTHGHEVALSPLKLLLEKMTLTGAPEDISIYNAYLDGLAKKGHCDEAQDLLDDLCRNYLAGTIAIKPDVVTFNTVMAGWRTAEKAEAVFRQMMTLAPQLDVTPTVISFTTLIAAFARNKLPEQAERYLQELRKMYASTGDESLRPDRRLYTTVLQAWKLSGDSRALSKCYSLINDLEHLNRSGVRHCSPDHMVYNTLLEVIAASSAPNKAEVAQSILDKMKSTNIRINKFTLDRVLLACAQLDRNATFASREVAFSIAHKTFHQLLQEFKPDHRMFHLFFQIASGLNHPNEVDEANKLYRKFSEVASQQKR